MTEATLERVEYQLSVDYVKNWGPRELLRELIANALDVSTSKKVDYRISFELDPDSDQWGTATIEDEGPGFKRAFLMVGGGTKKSSMEIGQFKEGLKLAMLVAARKKREFRMITTGFVVERVEIERGQLGGQGLVAYIDESRATKGCYVQVRVTQKEFNSAVRLFGGLNVTGHTVRTADIEDPTKFKVWRQPGTQYLYINGLEVQSTNNFFSYNLPGEKNIKESQNRDRTVVNWTDVKWRALKGLSMTRDQKLMDRVWLHVLANDGGADYPDIHDLKGYLHMQKASWRKGLTRIIKDHPQRNTRSSKLKLCGAELYEPETNLVAKEQGFTVVVSSHYPGMITCVVPRASEAIADDATKRRKDVEPVPNKDLTTEEHLRIEEVLEILRPYYSQGLPKVRVFSHSYVDANAIGYWYKGAVWIRRDQLEGDELHDLRRRLEIILHELCHWRSAAYDRTRDFELALGMLAADVILAARDAKVRPIDTMDTRSESRKQVEVQPAYSFDEWLYRLLIVREDMEFTNKALKDIEKCGPWRRVQLEADNGEFRRGHRGKTGIFLLGRSPRGKDVILRISQSKAQVKAGLYSVNSGYCWSDPFIRESKYSVVYEPYSPANEEMVA